MNMTRRAYLSKYISEKYKNAADDISDCTKFLQEETLKRNVII